MILPDVDELVELWKAEDWLVNELAGEPAETAVFKAWKLAAELHKSWITEVQETLRRGDDPIVWLFTANDYGQIRRSVAYYSQHPDWRFLSKKNTYSPTGSGISRHCLHIALKVANYFHARAE
jgi:hypothetical protein